MKTNRWARAGAPRVVGGAIVAAALSACTKGPPDCRADQYWSEPIRTCVGLRQWMESNDGAFPDGYVAPEASLEAGMDATVEAATPSCDGGQRACGASCSDLATDPLNCGACGAACPTAANASAACVAGRCDLRCDTGAHRCGASCLRDDDTASCGSRCTPCPEPLGARPTCAMGMCGYECLGGYDDTGSACEMRVARPLFPWGLSTVTMLRPTLRWELPMGVEGAQVELCRDRACTTVIERVNAVGTSARPSADLPASTVVFWRLRGRIGAVNSARTSATWQFRTPARSAMTADTAHGVELDVNGDGYSDVAIGAPGANGNTGRVDVYYGSAAGLGAMPAVTLRGSAMGDGFGSVVARLGDVNGDGFAELGVVHSGGTVSVYGGSIAGLSAAPTATLTLPSFSGGASVKLFAIGDVNGDGFSEIAASISDANVDGLMENGRAVVYLGSARGPGRTPSWTATGTSNGAGLGRAIAGATDFDGDRLGDIIVGVPGASPGGRIQAGHAEVFLGRATGLVMIADRLLEGVVAGDRFGAVIAATGSTDGDGYGDVIVGMPNAAGAAGAQVGKAVVFAGSAMGVSVEPVRELSGTDVGQQFAADLVGIGDIDRDGKADVAIAGVTQVSIFLGSVSSLSTTVTTTLRGPSVFDLLFGSIEHVGDINGDGLPELMISSPLAAPAGALRAGQVELWIGAPGGFATTSSRLLPGGAGDRLGEAIAERMPVRKRRHDHRRT
jgi:hypothetical protein